MAALTNILVIGGAAISALLLLVALRSAGKTMRIRTGLEWIRVAAGFASLAFMGLVVGARTPTVIAVLAVAVGAALGIFQGQQMSVERREVGLFATRSPWGMAVFAVGLIAMQLAGLGTRTGAFKVGQGIALFSVALTLGIIFGRRSPAGSAIVAGGAYVLVAIALTAVGLTLGASSTVEAQVSLRQQTDGQEQPEQNVTVVTGEVQLTLVWAGEADLDLYVTEPGTSTISYSNRSGSDGGVLDTDNNAGCTGSGSFVENIAWASGTPSGQFTAWVEHFDCSGEQIPEQSFRLEIRAQGKLEVVDTGRLTQGARSSAIRFEVNTRSGSPEIVQADGGDNLDQDPDQVGDGRIPTIVDENGNPINGDSETITDEEAVEMVLIAVLATLVMLGTTAAETGTTIIDLLSQGTSSTDRPQNDPSEWAPPASERQDPPLMPPPVAVDIDGDLSHVEPSAPDETSVGNEPWWIPPPEPATATPATTAPATSPTYQIPAGNTPGVHIPPGSPTADGQYEEAWRTLRQPSASNRVLSEDQYIGYLERLEAQFPSDGPGDFVNAMHRVHHRKDVTATYPFTPIPLFQPSDHDAAGSRLERSLDLSADEHEPPQNMVAFNVPKDIVVDGVKIDISHAIAGIRSHQGRESQWWITQQAHLRGQTNLGDTYQSAFRRQWDPQDQFDGDYAGHYLANFYAEPGNDAVPLSQAMRGYFNHLRATRPPSTMPTITPLPD